MNVVRLTLCSTVAAMCVRLSMLTAAVVTRLLLSRDEDNPLLVPSILPTTCGSALQHGKSWQVITLPPRHWQFISPFALSPYCWLSSNVTARLSDQVCCCNAVSVLLHSGLLPACPTIAVRPAMLQLILLPEKARYVLSTVDCVRSGSLMFW